MGNMASIAPHTHTQPHFYAEEITKSEKLIDKNEDPNGLKEGKFQIRKNLN